MDTNDIYRIAAEQSAIDLNCRADDFFSDKNKVVLSKQDERARKYLKLPHICSIVSYGSCAVASVGDERYAVPVKDLLDRYGTVNIFETPDVLSLDRFFAQYDAGVCFMAEYFLPQGTSDEPEIGYETKWLCQSDFKDLYLPEWSNALCSNRKELDVLGIGAYDNGKMAAFAACSADCENMWQIGIDVLPQYRGQGLSTALTVRLKNEILRRGKVPFYCAAWSNIRSVRNAISSGFRPAWVEIEVKSNQFIAGLSK